MRHKRGRLEGLPRIVALGIYLATAGCTAHRPAPRDTHAARPITRDFSALGTGFHVTWFAPDAAATTAAADAVAARLADLDAALSPDRTDSELSRLCAGAGGPARKLGDDLFAVLEFAQRVSRFSDGAFDVTAAPYLALWRRADEAGTEPAAQQLDVVRRLVGWTKLHLDPIERTAALEMPGMKLDPGPLSLGYAADQVLATLAARGLERAFVETDLGLFGRVRRFGAPPPGQEGWGLQLPPAPGPHPAPGPAHAIANAAMASSAPHRIIDPLTGKSVTDRPVVVVLARTGAAASALAAAAAVLGRERGPAVVWAAGAQAVFDSPVPPGAAGGRQTARQKARKH
jgi:thiamine biosynthesis lipoprotein